MESESNKLFVGGITHSTNATNLREYFSKYGQVKNVQVMRDRVTGESRGFGFVSFADKSSMESALQNEEHEILGRRVAVNIPRPIEKKPLRELPLNDSNRNSSPLKIHKIFVGGFPPSLTKEEFDRYFQTFGRIIDSVIMRNKQNNKPRGFGFVTYDSEESVQKVVMYRFHQLSNKLVEVKRAIPREEEPTKFCGHASYQVSWGFGHSCSDYLSYQMPCPSIGYLPYPSYYLNPFMDYFVNGNGSHHGHSCSDYLSYQMPCPSIGYLPYPSYYLSAPFMDYCVNGNGSHHGHSSCSIGTKRVTIQELEVVENPASTEGNNEQQPNPEVVEDIALGERTNELSQVVLHTNGVRSCESSAISDSGTSKNEVPNVVINRNGAVNGHVSEDSATINQIWDGSN